ncbi:MAG: hypothetical protein M0Z94_10905 [Dehalococcoidales bacterium]|nr:hypothetical protein [Dehalococcoidales bacterium]
MRDVAEIKARHLAFWERGPATRPLGTCWIGSRYPGELFPAASAIPTGRVLPGHIDVQSFMPDYERLYELHESTDDDAFWVASPLFGIPWNEAILGCPVYYSGESFWVEPIISDWHARPKLPLPEGEAWLAKLLEFTESLVRLAAGRHPVGTTLMRGPADLLAAVRGHVEMVYDLYDHPEQVQSMIDELTDVWLAVARMQLDRIPPFAGGYAVHFYRAWAPDRIALTQEDASASFSPDTYRRFLLAADRRIAAGLPYSVMHVHGTAIWPVEQMLGIEELSCIEINYDDNAPRLPELLPTLRRIQASKPLIIRGSFTDDEIAYVKRELSPCGLLLNIVVSSVAEARQLMDALRR